MNRPSLFFRFARAVVVGGALMTLAACASASSPTQMSAIGVTSAAAGEPGYHQLRVGGVQGGGETNPRWMSNVSSNDFRTALETSLRGAEFINPDGTKAAMEVTATIIDVKRPMAGLDMSVTTQVRYTVKPVGGGAAVFDETVAATGKAKMGEALIAVERLKLANEASVRENINSFIQRLRTALKAK
jgi:hypothetical protein